MKLRIRPNHVYWLIVLIGLLPAIEDFSLFNASLDALFQSKGDSINDVIGNLDQSIIENTENLDTEVGKIF